MVRSEEHPAHLVLGDAYTMCNLEKGPTSVVTLSANLVASCSYKSLLLHQHLMMDCDESIIMSAFMLMREKLIKAFLSSLSRE